MYYGKHQGGPVLTLGTATWLIDLLQAAKWLLRRRSPVPVLARVRALGKLLQRTSYGKTPTCSARLAASPYNHEGIDLAFLSPVRCIAGPALYALQRLRPDCQLGGAAEPGGRKPRVGVVQRSPAAKCWRLSTTTWGAPPSTWASGTARSPGSPGRFRSVRFIKIDVEGFEAEVLAGADDLLAGMRPEAILFEMNGAINSAVGEEPVIKIPKRHDYDSVIVPRQSVWMRLEPFDPDNVSHLRGHDVLGVAKGRSFDAIALAVRAMT